MNNKNRIVLGCSLGECVHVAGIQNFLKLSADCGYKTIFLGPAISIEDLIDAIKETDPVFVGVSYRLSPETADSLIDLFIDSLYETGLADKSQYLFAGTPPVAKIAQEKEFFTAVFSGLESIEDLLFILKGKEVGEQGDIDYPQNLIERIANKKPYPVIRHHFGLPSMDETIKGIKDISQAKILDIISLGTDQDAQENFFHPEKIDERRKGAGGVPVRTEEDFVKLHQASRCGNFPLMRTYAGTSELLKQAEVHVRSINNCFGVVPIFWFNQLDGRGPMTVVESIKTHQDVMAWYGKRDIPVEINEPHHWSLRDAPDEIFVAMGYISAYNAKAFGVGNYIAQFMFNTPANISFKMDLAKMLAVIEMTADLENESFKIIREARSGLLSYPVDMDEGKGQLASSTMLQMAIKPEIIHVVAYCEANHAAYAADVIESCRIVKKVIDNAQKGQPDMTHDPVVQKRKSELINEADFLISAIKNISNNPTLDPLTDAENLAKALEIGVLDAPHLTNSEFSKGKIRTNMIDGACCAIDPVSGEKIETSKRIAGLSR